MSINSFSKEVCNQIGYYVYRLIDPRNGQTFYVGKGKGNRVFEHVKCAIKYYDNADETSDSDPNKFKIIKSIHNDGLEVIHIIQRWNLTEDEAFQVEAALIDTYQGLTNLQRGHYSDYGITNAELLEKRFSCKVYDEPAEFKYMIIKVKNATIENIEAKDEEIDGRYQATRWRWKIKKPSIDEYPYVFSVTDGVVKEVYKVEKWSKSEDRFFFDGTVADKEIREKFRNTRIPDTYCKKGMASPVLYSKNEVVK